MNKKNNKKFIRTKNINKEGFIERVFVVKYLLMTESRLKL